jgi:hypothetical protein
MIPTLKHYLVYPQYDSSFNYPYPKTNLKKLIQFTYSVLKKYFLN